MRRIKETGLAPKLPEVVSGPSDGSLKGFCAGAGIALAIAIVVIWSILPTFMVAARCN